LFPFLLAETIKIFKGCCTSQLAFLWAKIQFLPFSS